MTRTSSHFVVILEILVFSIAGFLSMQAILSVLKWHETSQAQTPGTILRFPREPVPEDAEQSDQSGGLANIAPLAKVTVSSADTSSGMSAAGVADGTLDGREWSARRQLAGAWILLEWNRPAIVTGIALYDRQSPYENVLSGKLIFNDGNMIPVGALPSDGTPWRIDFPPRRVRWVEFRIDSAEGRNAGLGEIMVFGKLEQ